MGQRCSLATDVYALGILLIELATNRVGGKRGEWRLPRAPEDCPSEVQALILECVQADPLLRPSAAQALRRLKGVA